MSTDFVTVTEVPGLRASAEQVARMYHRYETAARYCQGKDVLEVACGAGQGLGYLARMAKSVVGGDYSEPVLRRAQEYYQGRTKLVRLDAHALPFADCTFDAILLFEAIYYLDSPERFLEECARLLRKGGLVLICTVNKDWGGFNPSPFSKRYFSAAELAAMVRARQFDVELLGAFPDSATSLSGKSIALMRRIALALHLIPKTMKGKEILKRIFFGKLSPLPPEIRPGMAEYEAPVPLPHCGADSQHKILYVVARACAEN